MVHIRRQLSLPHRHWSTLRHSWDTGFDSIYHVQMQSPTGWAYLACCRVSCRLAGPHRPALQQAAPGF